MKHIKAIIVEDEPKAVAILTEKIRRYFPEISIEAVYNNIPDAANNIELLAPDLVFLDISMHGEVIFSMLSALNNIQFQIIFITAFDHYAIDAIQYAAVGYVLKPIEDDKLQKAVKNALSKINEKSAQDNVSQLLQHLQHQTVKIALPTLEGLHMAHYNDIIYCKGDNKSTWIQLTTGKLLSSYNIGYYKQLLRNYSFINIHKSYIANLDHVSKYDKQGFVVMSNNEELPIARNFKKEFLGNFKRI